MRINKQKEALLSQELLKELLRYEYETGLFYWIKTGSGRKQGKPAGHIERDGYSRVNINGYRYCVHRLAWLYVHGSFPQCSDELYIDHINGNPSDNRIENLRTSSSAFNNRNSKKSSNNTSGIRGVSREEAWNGYRFYYYWVAYWHDENGKKKRKLFPIYTYGEDEAKQLATNYRGEQIRLLKDNFGIIYSNRHGE